jgi:adenylate cyclase
MEAEPAGRPAGTRRNRAILAACVLALLGLFLVPAVAPALLRLEHWAADWRTAFLSVRLRSAHPDIAIVAVTDETIGAYPYILPPDRGLLADIVTAADRAGARAIGLDFYFTKPTEKDKDEKLVAALRQAKDKLVLGAFEGRLREAQLAYQDDFLKRAGARVGFLNLQPERDYVVRYRAQPGSGARYRQSFSTLLAERPGRRAGPVPDRIAWLLPPRDGGRTFDRIEAHKLLDGTPGVAERLAGRVVLIGGDILSLDRHWTPLSLVTGSGMTGIEVHAHMTAELIDGKRSYAELGGIQARVFLVLLAALGVALGLRFQKRGWDFLDWRVASLGVIAVDLALFRFLHLILPFTLAAVAWIAGVTLGRQLRQLAMWPTVWNRGET